LSGPPAEDRKQNITKNLSASQARLYQLAIDNNRRLQKIIEEMRGLSLEILEMETTKISR